MKKQSNSDNLLVAIDIGTTKICVLIAQRISADEFSVIGIGKAPSCGVARGIVVDITQAVHSVKLALKEAELMAGCKIESACVGISGSHIQSINSHGMMPIKGGRIRPFDVASAVAAAKAVALPEGQQILHVLPQYYIIDSQQKVLDPVGMFGVRLEAQVHIITGSIASVQNLVRCCTMAGVNITDVILEPLASASSVLSKDERHLGIALLDIGGGTSDFAVYQDDTIRHTKVFPVAGNHVTYDIALCLRTTIKDAERVKRTYGRTVYNNIDIHGQFDIEMVQGTEKKLIYLSELISIVEPRVTELLYMVKQEIDQKHLEDYMPAGLVLTGGGALLQGIKESADSILNIPVRIGNPKVHQSLKESLESPIYATGYGLLLYMLKDNRKSSMDHLTGPLINRILWRMKSWVSDFF